MDLYRVSGALSNISALAAPGQLRCKIIALAVPKPLSLQTLRPIGNRQLIPFYGYHNCKLIIVVFNIGYLRVHVKRLLFVTLVKYFVFV